MNSCPEPTPLQRICLRLLLKRLAEIRQGHLLLRLPDGTEHHFGQSTESPCELLVNHYRFPTRLLLGGNIGFGESWTDADWDSPDLTALLELFIRNMAVLSKGGLATGAAKRILHLLLHARNRNTRAGSKRNIHAHYDLGNDFYQTFLDTDTMMYSAALFVPPDASLSDAQRAKIHKLITLATIDQTHHVLEIGCGWGGFAIEAARHTGCRVTGVTISQEQFDFATARIREAGLQDRVEIQLCDYRDVQGSFDRIVSIEMLEAVGHSYYGSFFSSCDRLLKPSGCAAIQVITIPDQRYDTYRRSPDWIQKHIFPGGMLPSLTELSKAIRTHSAFTIEALDNIGPHYAETLRRWRKAFVAHHDPLLAMGYDEAFQRKWIYYLSYCEAGFQMRFTNTLHLLLVRPGPPPAETGD